VEIAADTGRAGRAVQPEDVAGVEATAEQEAEKQDHSLGDAADQPTHGSTVDARLGRAAFKG
jgi:hypothetical protein